MGRALRRLPPRTLQILDRLDEVIAADVMMGQLVQMVLQLPSENRLEGLSGALVQELAALDQYRVVGDLLRQRMLEDVFDIAGGRLFVDELRRLQVGEHTLQLITLPSVEHPPDQRQRELPANHGERLQQLLLIGGQTV